jgi:hypothetical protein
MFKIIRDISNAVKDMAAIAGKEVMHQVSKAGEYSGAKTEKLAKKAAELRKAYEDNLLCRKEGVDGILEIRKADENTNVE